MGVKAQQRPTRFVREVGKHPPNLHFGFAIGSCVMELERPDRLWPDFNRQRSSLSLRDWNPFLRISSSEPSNLTSLSFGTSAPIRYGEPVAGRLPTPPVRLVRDVGARNTIGVEPRAAATDSGTIDHQVPSPSENLRATRN